MNGTSAIIPATSGTSAAAAIAALARPGHHDLLGVGAGQRTRRVDGTGGIGVEAPVVVAVGVLEAAREEPGLRGPVPDGIARVTGFRRGPPLTPRVHPEHPVAGGGEQRVVPRLAPTRRVAREADDDREPRLHARRPHVPRLDRVTAEPRE